jgi:F0F1-type ATP synthase membrane subunit b/b'
MLKKYLDKILDGLTTVGIFLLFVFYMLYNREKAKRIVTERKLKIKEAEDKAKEIAEKRHEEAKKNGSVGVANDIADLIDE